MEKIITIKKASFPVKNDKQWCELVDFEDKTHRIFAGVKLNSGEWRDLADKIAYLKDLHDKGELEGKAIKLIKEKQGQYYNAIDFELDSDGLQVNTEKQANKPKSVSTEIRENMEWKDKQINEKFWWGQLGECLRTGEIDKSSSHGKLLRAAFYVEMFHSLNLKIEHKEP